MFENFTDKAIKAVMLAQEETRRLGHKSVGTEQILLGLIAEGTGIAAKVLNQQGANLALARSAVEKIMGRGPGGAPTEIPFTPKARQIFQKALEESQQLGHRYIGTEHLLLGLTQDNEGMAAKVLVDLNIDREQTRTAVLEMLQQSAPVSGKAARKPAPSAAVSTSLRTLTEFGRNLTQLAAEGKLEPLVGRQKEVERVMQILGRRTKNNPVLIGEPGVGKTAIAEGLAQRIHDHQVPELLQDKQVISLDMGLLIAGTRFRGEFEERLQRVLEEVKTAGNIILVIDEIHTLVGAGAISGSLDAANLFKPALARGELQCIGATTLDEYRQHIEQDAALERRFQPVKVGEPTVAETIAILQGLRDRYEQHHRVKFSDAVLEAAAKLSERYIPDRLLPDKAINLIDEAGSRVRLRHTPVASEKQVMKQELRQVTQEKQLAVREQDFDRAGQLRDRELELQAQLQKLAAEKPAIPVTTVEESDITQIVAAWTGVPVNKLSESESEMLLHLEETLHQRLIGQDEAVTAVSRAVRRSQSGLRDPDRPIASLIFSGPTGVGKTELAKALAAYLFGSETAMVRLDMSEYMESHTISKLIGSPPGYVGYGEGGQLTEAVRRQPYTVLLFDEIEKAHPDVFNLLLQILEDGRLTDSQGRRVSFKNTLLIMTSNIGSKVIEKGGTGLGFELLQNQADAQYQHTRAQVQEELKAHFRPEFLNRIDEIIVFRQLTRPEVAQIADLMLREIADRLTSEHQIRLQVSDRGKDKLTTEGYDPRWGARSMRRTITRWLEDALAEAILSGQIQPGDTAQVDVDAAGEIQVQAVRQSESLLQPVG